MVHFVNDKCIKCKYTDCVEVCPVDCFHEVEEMLVIDPDSCIDCGVCVAECPIEAIVNDDTFIDGKSVEDILVEKNYNNLTDNQKQAQVLCQMNCDLSQNYPVITNKKEELITAEEFKDKLGKIQYVSCYIKREI